MLEVFIPYLGKTNASTYYRIEQPMDALTGLTPLPVNVMMDDGLSTTSNETRTEAWINCDINFMWNPVGKGVLDNILLMKSWKAGLNNAGDIQYPPSYVITTDDAMFDVMPYNPTFRDLGIKDLNGRMLVPGDEVTVKLPDESSPRVLYRDGEKGFNIKNNVDKLNLLKQIYSMADGLIVTTPVLQKYFKDNLNLNAYVIPNCVSENDFPQLELKQHTKEIRLLWQGSTTHVEDVWEVEDALARVMNKYPNVTLTLMGALYASLMKRLPMDRVKVIPYRPFKEGYYNRLAAVNHDINLALLSNNLFGSCRSGIKWYEASSLCRPVPTLAGRVGPYLEIEDGTTGLLYTGETEFETKLCGLIEDATLRKTLADNAKDWVRENRNPAKWAYKYYEVFQNVRAKMREDKPYEEPIDGTLGT